MAVSSSFFPSLVHANDGPTVRFMRQGARVCAQYSLNGDHDLYKNHLFAHAADQFIPIEGLPKGVSRHVAGIDEQLIAQSFTACVSAPSPDAPLIWIDQSCLNQEALCLPPRAFEISATGQRSLLPVAKSASLFASALFGSKAKNSSNPEH
jgi:hypothetical protein